MTTPRPVITLDELNALVAERHARETAEMQRLLALQAPPPRAPSRARRRREAPSGRVPRGGVQQ